MNIQAFGTEKAAFKAAGDKVASLCLEGKPNCGFRVLKRGDQYVVLLVPDRESPRVTPTPYYLSRA